VLGRGAKPRWRVSVRPGASGARFKTSVYYAEAGAAGAARLARERGMEAYAWNIGAGMPDAVREANGVR